MTDARRFLVAIRRGGDLPPLHLVHSLAGELTWLPPLARLLDARRPLYGFAAPGLNAKGPGFARLEDMAAGYLAAVRTVQPHGPYLFGGYSFGGIVAYEMARQARDAGEAVAGLVLVDSYTPDSGVMRALERWVTDGVLVQSVGNMLAIDWGARELLAPGALPPGDPAAQIDVVTRHLLDHCDVPHGYEALSSLLDKCRHVMAEHTRMLAAYRPRPPSERLDALLVHNTQGFIGAGNPLRLPDVPALADGHGWEGYLLDPPRQVGVATEHFLMMRPPALDQVATFIDAHLQRQGSPP
jgi:thioesterase domain-containing protein